MEMIAYSDSNVLSTREAGGRYKISMGEQICLVEDWNEFVALRAELKLCEIEGIMRRGIENTVVLHKAIFCGRRTSCRCQDVVAADQRH